MRNEMKKDRMAIMQVISVMLDNPSEYGIYPTTKAYDTFENLFNEIRIEALGWMYAQACTMLDNGEDMRAMEVSNLLKEALKDLSD
jgi:hypothetical protein